MSYDIPSVFVWETTGNVPLHHAAGLNGRADQSDAPGTELGRRRFYASINAGRSMGAEKPRPRPAAKK